MSRFSFGLPALALVAGAISAPPARAATWHVYDIADLNNAETYHASGDEIILYPGTYQLSQYLNLNKSDVTFRGSTGDPDDVVIRGAGMNVQSGPLNGLMIENDDITVRDLTVKDIFWNGIQIRGEWDVDNTVISNVKTINIGERHVKGSRGTSGDMENVLIERVQMIQNQPLASPHPNLDYVGGIDAMACRNWIVRDCLFEGIAGASGGGRGGIFLWNGVSNAVIERNVFIGCDRGIAFGNPSGPTNSITDPWHTEGGIIRNNAILRGDYIALELCNTKDLKVYNNTVYSPDASYFRTLHILDQAGEGATTNLQLVNNIIRGNVLDNTVGGGWTPAAIAAMGNIVDTTGTVVLPGWFVDPGNGDLHLTASATAAIDGALSLPEVTDDIDRGARPAGAAPDIGADEYGSTGPQPPPDYPTVEHTVKYLGGGKYGVSFTIHGNDDPVLASFFANMTFEGTAGGQIQQVQALGSFDVDNETDADSWDGVGDPPYDKDADSWFGDPFAKSPPASILALTEAANYYHVEAGTGGASAYEDAKLAYIVTTGDVSFYGVISRLAENYDVSAIAEMPLPGDANEDGSVDGADYTTWADNYQSGGVGWGGGDYNGDDVVDGGDYTIWADFYTGGGAIPEPATLTLLALGTMVMLRRRQ